MSGGVDSSVVAALHAARGPRRHRHHAAALRSRRGDGPQGKLLRRPGHPRCAPRCGDASASPTTCSITRAASRKPVMSSFAESYAAGETPIPCVTCNQQIKFRDLLDTAKELGADALATGHYIQRREGASRPRACARRRCRARPELFPVRHHAARSSSYLRFPARRHAEGARCARSRASLALPVAEKADSQDICFVPTGRYTASSSA